MAKNRLTIIGLENGQKRTLVWEDNELYGDQDLKDRFIALFRVISEEDQDYAIDMAFSIFQPRMFISFFDKLFEDTLDIYAETILDDSEFECFNGGKAIDPSRGSIPLEERRLEYITFNRNRSYGPPHSWEQIEPYINNPFVPEDDVEVPSIPTKVTKCPECLQPMKWILCGIPRRTEDQPMYGGLLPICVRCRRWKQIENEF